MVALAIKQQELPPAAAGASLDIEGVSHSFDIDGTVLPVLDNVSFRIKPGESSRCSVRPDAGNRPCCGWLPGLNRRARARCAKMPSRSQDRSLRGWWCFRIQRCFHGGRSWNNVALGLEAQGILKAQRQSCRRCDRSCRAVGVPQRLSASAFGRHGAAGRAGAGAGQRSQDPHSRRTARQARFADAHHDAGGDRFAVATQRLHHAVGDARRGGGGVSRQPYHRVQRSAGADQGGHSSGPAIPAASWRS